MSNIPSFSSEVRAFVQKHKKHGLTLTHLAEASKVTVATISKLCSGDQLGARYETFMKIREGMNSLEDDFRKGKYLSPKKRRKPLTTTPTTPPAARTDTAPPA